MKSRFKVLRVGSHEWIKATKTADEKELMQILENNEEKVVPFIYIHKDKKKPDKWTLFAIIDTTNQKGRILLDEIAQKLGFPVGLVDKNFINKFLREFPDRILKKDSKFKVIVIKGKDWLKSTKQSDETELVKLLDSSPDSIPFVYTYKSKKKPDEWIVMAIFDSSDKKARDIIDEIAQKMGYNEGIMDRKFQQKFIRNNLK